MVAAKGCINQIEFSLARRLIRWAKFDDIRTICTIYTATKHLYSHIHTNICINCSCHSKKRGCRGNYAILHGATQFFFPPYHHHHSVDNETLFSRCYDRKTERKRERKIEVMEILTEKN